MTRLTFKTMSISQSLKCYNNLKKGAKFAESPCFQRIRAGSQLLVNECEAY